MADQFDLSKLAKLDMQGLQRLTKQINEIVATSGNGVSSVKAPGKPVPTPQRSATAAPKADDPKGSLAEIAQMVTLLEQAIRALQSQTGVSSGRGVAALASSGGGMQMNKVAGAVQDMNKRQAIENSWDDFMTKVLLSHADGVGRNDGWMTKNLAHSTVATLDDLKKRLGGMR